MTSTQEIKSIQRKIDFAVFFSVQNANPNGDPLNENRPRMTSSGFGEISDVCIKRKIRDRLKENKKEILIEMTEKSGQTLSDKIKIIEKEIKKQNKDEKESNCQKLSLNISQEACKKWFDVRAFGQVVPLKESEISKHGLSIAIRGPVSIHPAFSLHRVRVTNIQITKCMNNTHEETGKSSDTMGLKHRIDHGIYRFYGSINPQLAEKTGFTEEDAESLRKILPRLFENDCSSSRPEGSMRILKVLWWIHDTKNPKYSSAYLYDSIKFLEEKDANGQLLEQNIKLLQDLCTENLKEKILQRFESLERVTLEIENGF